MVTPIAAIGVACLIVCAVRQKIKYIRLLEKDDWNIGFFDIEFQVARRSHPPDEQRFMHRRESFNCIGNWNGHFVAVRMLHTTKIFDVNRKVRQALMRMRDTIDHENVARFYGLTLSYGAAESRTWFLIEESCDKGPFNCILCQNRYKLTDALRYAIATEIVNGMTFLHRYGIVHGSLKTSSCRIDSRWTVKIVNWEHASLYDAVRTTTRNGSDPLSGRGLAFQLSAQPQHQDQRDRDVDAAYLQFWSPPMVVGGHPDETTMTGDVFNFGMIMYEIFAIRDPFSTASRWFR